MPPRSGPPDFTISLLTPEDDLSKFDCGDDARNKWLTTRALNNDASDDSRTYAARLTSGEVIGFYSLTLGSLLRSSLPGALRRNAPNPVGCVLLAQLGVGVAWQGQGIGGDLILHAMVMAIKISEIAGSRLLAVHLATSELASYYAKFGFVVLDAAPGPAMAISTQKLRLMRATRPPPKTA